LPHHPRRPGYIEPHRRNTEEDRYWRRRRRLTAALAAWLVIWLAIIALALLLP
jgi:hypothetical protein